MLRDELGIDRFDSAPAKDITNLTNLTKHGITFSWANESLHDPNAICFFDAAHSDDEDRFVTIGVTYAGKFLFTMFTMRDERYTIISTRLAEKADEELYWS